jgi:hypothetical protein
MPASIPTPVQGIQAQIDLARGIAASVIGQLYDVYRLNPKSTGAIVSPSNLVIGNFPVKMTRNTQSLADEQAKIYELVYQGLCDVSRLRIGDILVEKGFRSDPGKFILAQERPLKPYMFVRVEINGAVTRQSAISAEPLLGLGPYQATTKAYESVAQLRNGMFAYVQGGSPAQIPIGIQIDRRMGQTPRGFKLPTVNKLEEVSAYVPLLPGLQIQPTDMLADANGNRYLVHAVQIYTAGLVGYLIKAQKLLI